MLYYFISFCFFNISIDFLFILFISFINSEHFNFFLLVARFL